MSNRIIAYAAGLFLCGSLIMQAGCTTSQGRGGMSVFDVNKRVSETAGVSSLEAYRAAMAALRDLNMPVTGDYHDTESVEIKSRFADGETGWVEITPLNESSCKLTVRVGILGDESRSRSLLDAIMRYMPGQPSERAMQPAAEAQRPTDNAAVKSMQNPEDYPAETQPDQLKPLPKDDVNVKSLM